MSQSDRAIKKLATQLARLDRELKSWRGAQADFTSIEAGTMDINDSDGNLVSRVGYQEDGSGATRFFDGPIPPVPSGVTASSDGPIIQATWDGTFEGGAEATYDLAYLEVAATQIDDDTNVSFATITAKEGASASVVADVTGDWVVAVRSVSQAGKKSEFATAGTVEVKLTDVAGAIEAVQDSANGKNKVTYSEHAPTPEDPGIFDDTWFVGQVGRPNDIVEATNLATNPSFTSLALPVGAGNMSSRAGATLALSTDWSSSGSTSLKISGGTTWYTAAYLLLPGGGSYPDNPNGKTYTASVDFHLENAHDDSTQTASRRLTVNVRRGGSMQYEFAMSDKAGAAAGTTERLSVTFTVPSDAEYFEITAFNGSQTSTSYWDSFDFAEVSSARPYFDGDTEDGATDNESHYRWTGTPHASTSEKYLPALNIGDSDNWNIIEQYRHDGNGWVKVELSHYVFSTVDLGKATVGELDGIRIMARTITGDLFTGDAFDGIVFRGNTFTTRDGNGEFSDRGLFFQKPDGTAIFRVPTDGAPISMSASDVQIERAQTDQLELNVGRVRSGGLLELSSGVTEPASPPELNAAWKRATTLPAPEERTQNDNLAYWENGDKWVRAINVIGVGEGDRVEIYEPTTGEVVGAHPVTINPNHGVTVMGDTVYIFGSEHGIPAPRVFVHGYDLVSGDRVTRWEYTRGIQAKNPLGNDGTNLIVASVYNLELWVHRRDPATGEQVGSDMRSGSNSWPASGGKDLYAVRIDGNDVEVVTSWGGRVYANNSNVLTHKSDSANASGWAGWVLPDHNVTGCVWVDDRPFVVNGSGVVFEGSTRASDYAAEVCFTWYDGTYETTPSPVATINVAARETVTISLPHREGLQKQVYTREGTRWRRNTIPAETTVADIHTGVLVLGLPTTNSFPAADPAVLRTTNNTFRVRGDGSGNWGPLKMGANGIMSGLIVTETVNQPNVAPNSNVENTVVLPEGRFTKPPAVVVSATNGRVTAIADNITTTSFRLRSWNFTSETANTNIVTWIALDG